MACKVLDLTEKTRIKKSVAELLVRRLLAAWVVKNVSIRRLNVRDITALAPCRDVPYLAPPSEPSQSVPGARLKFEPPKSDTWRRQHRLTVLGLESISDAEKAS